MITKDQYKTIRNRRDFLHAYFILSGGVKIQFEQFAILLGVWIESNGFNVAEGTRKIVVFLDKKFDYK